MKMACRMMLQRACREKIAMWRNENDTNLISVIVPIYRVEQYLEQCIQSIRNQTHKNLEIILVDDGSDDRCPQICDYFASVDNRIKVIHKENGGPDSARKAGMLEATGKYVGYVDGDDWINQEMYESLLRFAYTYNVDIVESGIIDSWEKSEKKRTAYLPEGCYKGKEFVDKVESKLLYAGEFFAHGVAPYLWSKLFIREKIMKYQMLGGITNEILDDIMVVLPCVAESKNIYISYECYYHYRVRENSLKRKHRPEEVNLLKCYSSFYARFKGTKLCSKDDKQIKYYIMYRLLQKTPCMFDDLSKEEFLVAFGGIGSKNRIVLYGAGAAGIHLENYLRGIEMIDIVCWADCNFEQLQPALDVCDPKEIMEHEYDYVVISILRESAVKSAKKDLVELGVPEETILWIKQEYIDDPDLLLSRVIGKESMI